MQYKLLVAVLSLLIGIKAGAQASTTAPTASVYFMRSTGSSGWGDFHIFIDDSTVCYLRNNHYVVQSVLPGLHRFQVRFAGGKPRKRIKTLDLPLKAGENYYISVAVTDQSFSYTVELMEVTINTANKMLPALKEDKPCKPL